MESRFHAKIGICIPGSTVGEKSGSHRLMNLISVVERIFPKLIRDEITKHLENILFLCVLKEKEGERKRNFVTTASEKEKTEKFGVNV